VSCDALCMSACSVRVNSRETECPLNHGPFPSGSAPGKPTSRRTSWQNHELCRNSNTNNGSWCSTLAWAWCFRSMLAKSSRRSAVATFLGCMCFERSLSLSEACNTQSCQREDAEHADSSKGQRAHQALLRSFDELLGGLRRVLELGRELEQHYGTRAFHRVQAALERLPPLFELLLDTELARVPERVAPVIRCPSEGL